MESEKHSREQTWEKSIRFVNSNVKNVDDDNNSECAAVWTEESARSARERETESKAG